MVSVFAGDPYRCTIEPVAATIAVGGMQQFDARAYWSDCHDTSQIITGYARWSSSDTSVASVADSAPAFGLAQGLAEGQVTITAKYFSFTCSASLTVTP